MKPKSFLLKGNYQYSPSHRLLEIFGVIVFTLFCILIGIEIYNAFPSYFSGATLVPLLLLILIAYFTADFISGFVHFLGDTFGTSETPVLGPGFIKPFRDHHTDPQGIVRHDWIEVNGSNCVVSLFVIIPVYFSSSVQTSINAFFGSFYVLMLVMFILFTNQFHKWAHMKQPPAFVVVLQKMRLILPPDHHSVHHSSPYNKYYCITCGWLNPFLLKIRFFEFSEKIIRKIIGSKESV